MSKPTVFVTQDNGKNLTPAMEFGDIKVLATRDVPLFGNPTHVLSGLRSKLSPYNPDRDYLICAGDPLLIGAAIHYIASQFGKVRCLKWDRQNLTYHFIELPLN